MLTSDLTSVTETPCSPISQISSTLLPVIIHNRDRSLQRELPTTGRAKQYTPTQSRRILKWLVATDLAISK